MKCLHPISVKVCKEGNKLNPYLVQPPIYRLMPCGKCVACRMRRAMQWGFRLEQEWKVASNAFFVTITYAPENLPQNYQLAKDDYLKFVKDVSMAIRRYCDLKGIKFNFRYLGIGEYGFEKGRPHYHFIWFNVPNFFFDMVGSKWKILAEQFIERRFWPKGFVDLDSLSYKRIMYVSKYVVKAEDFDGSKVRPFMTCSKRPFIGHSYLNTKVIAYHRKSKDFLVRNDSGYWLGLPRVYWPYIWNKYELWYHSAEMLRLEQEREESVEFFRDGEAVNPYNGFTDTEIKEIERLFRKKQYEKHMRRKHFRGIS